jgi:hypothetical protein
MQACHVNDNPQDNRPSNLKWGTRKENGADAVRNGKYATTRCKGVQHHSAKLNLDKVREIRRRHAAGETQKSLAREFHIRQSTIYGIVHNKTWKHVDDSPDEAPMPMPVEIAKVFILDRLRGGDRGLVKRNALYVQSREATASGRMVFQNAIDLLERDGQVVVVRPGDDEGYYRSNWVGYLGVINLGSLAFEW